MYKYNSWEDNVDSKLVKKNILFKDKKSGNLSLKDFMKAVLCENNGMTAKNRYECLDNICKDISDNILIDLFKTNYFMLLLSSNKIDFKDVNVNYVNEFQECLIEMLKLPVGEQKNKLYIESEDTASKRKRGFEDDTEPDLMQIEDVTLENISNWIKKDSKQLYLRSSLIEPYKPFKNFRNNDNFLLDMLSDINVNDEEDSWGVYQSGFEFYTESIFPELQKRELLNVLDGYKGSNYVRLFKSSIKEPKERMLMCRNDSMVNICTRIIAEEVSVVKYLNDEFKDSLLSLYKKVISHLQVSEYDEKIQIFLGLYPLYKITRNEDVLKIMEDLNIDIQKSVHDNFNSGNLNNSFNGKNSYYSKVEKVLELLNTDEVVKIDKFKGLFFEKVKENELLISTQMCVMINVDLEKLINYQNTKWNDSLGYFNIRKLVSKLWKNLGDDSIWKDIKVESEKLVFTINPPFEMSQDDLNIWGNKIVGKILGNYSLTKDWREGELSAEVEKIIMLEQVNMNTVKGRKIKF